MRMEAERTDDLREAFASLGSPPSSGKECPEPDHLWRAAAGDLSGNEARTIVAHTSVCVSCSREWRLAKELGARPIDVPQETSETIGGAAGFWQIMNLRLVPAIAGVGFVVVVAILGLQYWPRATEPGFRGASDSQIVSSVPDDVALDRDDCLFRWTVEGPAAAVRFDLRIATGDLTEVLSVRGLGSPEFRVPSESLSSVPSGGILYWTVDAYLEDGSELSAVFASQLR